ncbi:hypothetical protein GUJ93_ZPchr0008g11651 [Zizania palustris]|uniref:Secreted protein n=1 Tax=Zizania palustris TaxID=103762 RepID=A0A8J5QX98_ZIZPA|nr:hypothetical protein GUJ93_ZPchr0008g11651 [Zizania palustris]
MPLLPFLSVFFFVSLFPSFPQLHCSPVAIAAEVALASSTLFPQCPYHRELTGGPAPDSAASSPDKY